MKSNKESINSIAKRWEQITRPGLEIEALMSSYPDIWEHVKESVKSAVNVQDVQHINELITKADASAQYWHALVKKEQGTTRIKTEALPHLVRSRMIHLSIQKILTASLTGSKDTVPQSRFDKILCNSLFYIPYSKHDPVNETKFRLLWPFMRNKNVAIAVAKRLGFYSFFTNRILDYLAPICLGKTVLEIAAGSGILTLLLNKRGVDCVATDDFSWNHAVRYGHHVLDLSAKTALKKIQPEVVLCSWPPPENSFERFVFACESVQEYFVIGSAYEFATGARTTYLSQTEFHSHRVGRPEKMLVPPELSGEIFRFTRKARPSVGSTTKII